MGILNVTPDSFSDGGKFNRPEKAIHHAQQMLEDGADWIDVGGESTRPGAKSVSVQEEIDRVMPVLEGIAGSLERFSIDTSKPEVAELALKAGVGMINDVTGFTNPQMLALAGKYKPQVCVMHLKGDPKTMQNSPEYGDVVGEVLEFLNQQASLLRKQGLTSDQIWIDPGIGFGKTLEQNLEILRNLDAFTMGENPVLLGVSRKSFISKAMELYIGEVSLGDRMPGSLAVQTIGQLRGAKMLRVHDVKEAVQAAILTDLVG